MEQARVERIVDHPIGEVWAVVSSFGGLRGWIPGLQVCSLDGVGVGAVRTVTVAGHTVAERLVAIDAAAHLVSYAVMPPHPFPAEGVVGTIRLTAVGQRTNVAWWCEADRVVGSPDLLVRMIEKLYGSCIAGLDRVLSR